jgi:amidase
VKGAEAGDLLAVHIKDIIPADQSWTGTLRPIGIVQDLAGWEECHGWYGIMIDNEPGPSGTTADGTATFEINDHEWTWDLNPHIGTFATAPARGVQDSLTSQGPWGGNLDVRDVAKGNTIYVNSFNEGGLLFLGDVHASQGTETAFANETKAEVILSIDVIKNKTIPGAFRIETPDSIIQVECAKNAGTSNKAIAGAYIGLMEWLIEEHEYGRREAYLQTSANPNVRSKLYQFFPKINFCAAGVEISKDYLR